MLQWLMDAAEGIETQADHLVSRLLMANFAALHTLMLVIHSIIRLTTGFDACSL
jgi:hypothetical protein